MPTKKKLLKINNNNNNNNDNNNNRRSYPRLGGSHGQETFPALSAEKQTRTYNTECSYIFKESRLLHKMGMDV